jgi:curved DNA-binding protein CbpA
MNTTPNLYEILGVAKDALVDDVRKAYRRAAKKTHPDVGGSRESFDLVRLAVDVLSDDKRRRQYDETGEIGERPVDQLEAAALTIVMNAVNNVLDRIVKQHGNPAHYDVVNDAIGVLHEELAKILLARESAKATVEKVREVAKRFRSKKKSKPNRISRMFTARADEIERSIAQNDRERERVELAISILKDHAWDYDDMDSRDPFHLGRGGSIGTSTRW